LTFVQLMELSDDHTAYVYGFYFSVTLNSLVVNQTGLEPEPLTVSLTI